MKITPQDVKGAIQWEKRIFFRDYYSEDEEIQWVINYTKTAEALNRIVEAVDYAAANDDLR